MAIDQAVPEVLCKKLEELYSIIQQLRSTLPISKFQTFASYFASDCTVYWKSMNMHAMPAISRQEVIEDLKEVLGIYQVEKRDVLCISYAAKQRTIFCETKQRIRVLGDIIEPFFETEIVSFDETGLITNFRLYNCWSPIMRIVQDKTGRGPYAEGQQREQFEAFMQRAANARLQRRRNRADIESTQKAQQPTSASCCA